MLARTHQSLLWTRPRHITGALGAAPVLPGRLAAFGTDLAHPDALEVVRKAPTPSRDGLSTAQIRSALKRGGRQRNLDRRAEQIRDALRREQLEAPPLVADAFGTTIAALVLVVTALNEQIATLEARLAERFEQHPDADLILSLPGLGVVLGARVLAEFGDAPNRYAGAKARRNYAGPSPITKASGTSRVVMAGFKRNRRLIDACWQWAFCALLPASACLLRAHRLPASACLLRRAQPRTPHIADRSAQARQQARGCLHGVSSSALPTTKNSPSPNGSPMRPTWQLDSHEPGVF